MGPLQEPALQKAPTRRLVLPLTKLFFKSLFPLEPVKQTECEANISSYLQQQLLKPSLPRFLPVSHFGSLGRVFIAPIPPLRGGPWGRGFRRSED